MNYIVFDLEWNIAGRANKVDPGHQAIMPHEIIEIGAVKLDDAFRQISRFSVYIRPKLYPILSGHIAAVTRRLQQSLRYGLSFPDAARDFFDWCGEDYLFVTWTESDTATLKMNLRFYEMNVQLAKCLDAQFLFDRRIEKAGTQRSIEYALDFLSLPKNQPFHQAVSDAFYTGQILARTAEILAQESFGEDFINRYAFDPNLNHVYQLTLDGPVSTEDAMRDLRDRDLACPACGLGLLPREDWSRQGNKAEAAFGCPVHGPIRGKGRLRTKGETMLKATVTIRLDRDQGS